MLEEFKDIDTIVYRQLYNGLKKLSHAYLFNLNNNVYAEDMIMSFVKSIMCKYHTDKEEYNNCYVCKRIDDGNFTELKIIFFLITKIFEKNFQQYFFYILYSYYSLLFFIVVTHKLIKS